ncbi:MAG: hypothetical protein GY870_09150 [archaeon]|nr:hypothetical protein [archaeon]
MLELENNDRTCNWCEKNQGKKIKMIIIEVEDEKIAICPVCQIEISL